MVCRIANTRLPRIGAFRPFSFIDRGWHWLFSWVLTVPAFFAELSSTEVKPVDVSDSPSDMKRTVRDLSYDPDTPTHVAAYELN